MLTDVTAAIAIYSTRLITLDGLTSNFADLKLNLYQHCVLSFLVVSFLRLVPDVILLRGVLAE